MPSCCLSFDRNQILHIEKLTELLKVNKKFVGNRKPSRTLTFLQFDDADLRVNLRGLEFAMPEHGLDETDS